jgi:hypothetical protein
MLSGRLIEGFQKQQGQGTEPLQGLRQHDGIKAAAVEQGSPSQRLHYSGSRLWLMHRPHVGKMNLFVRQHRLVRVESLKQGIKDLRYG